MVLSAQSLKNKGRYDRQRKVRFDFSLNLRLFIFMVLSIPLIFSLLLCFLKTPCGGSTCFASASPTLATASTTTTVAATTAVNSGSYSRRRRRRRSSSSPGDAVVERRQNREYYLRGSNNGDSASSDEDGKATVSGTFAQSTLYSKRDQRMDAKRRRRRAMRVNRVGHSPRQEKERGQWRHRRQSDKRWTTTSSSVTSTTKTASAQTTSSIGSTNVVRSRRNSADPRGWSTLCPLRDYGWPGRSDDSAFSALAKSTWLSAGVDDWGDCLAREMSASITELYFGNACLYRVPAAISTFSEMQNLYLFDTCLEGANALPSSISLLTKIEVLDLEDNPGLIELPDALSALRNLKDLDLEDNTGLRALPMWVFALPYLEDFDCAGCTRLTSSSIPPVIRAPNLKYYDVSDSLVDFMPIFPPSIVYIDVSGSRVTTIADFRDLPNIYYYDSSYTGITELPEEYFDFRPPLERLYLHYNALKTVPRSIARMHETLKRLDISYNPITELPEELGELVNLERFECVRTDIETVPSSLQRLNKLEKLYLARNKRLRSLPVFSCDRLGNFWVSECPLLTEYPSWLTNCSSLYSFAVGETGITWPEDLDWSVWPYLEEIWLYRSPGLTSLSSSIGSLKGLEWLDLDATSLRRLPDSISNLATLESLSVGGPMLETLDNVDWSKLTSLEELLISKSPRLKSLPASLSTLPCYWFDISSNPQLEFPDFSSGWTNLEELYANEMNLSAVPPSIARLSNTLETLALTKNQISEFPSWLADRMPRLEELILGSNALETLPDSFAGLPALELLDLGDNLLAVLPADVSPHIEYLYLQKNRISKLPASPRAIFGAGADAMGGREREAAYADYINRFGQQEDSTLWDGDLTALSEVLFYGMTGLTELRLQHNDIREVPIWLHSLARRFPQMLLSLEDNPSSCFREWQIGTGLPGKWQEQLSSVRRLDSLQTGLVCDCAAGYTGRSYCMHTSDTVYTPRSYASCYGGQVSINIPSWARDPAMDGVIEHSDNSGMRTSLVYRSPAGEEAASAPAGAELYMPCTISSFQRIYGTNDRVRVQRFDRFSVRVNGSLQGTDIAPYGLPMGFVQSAFVASQKFANAQLNIDAAAAAANATTGGGGFAIRGEIEKETVYPISRADLGLPDEVKANPTITTSISFVTRNSTCPVGTFNIDQQKQTVVLSARESLRECQADLFAVDSYTQESLFLQRLKISIFDCINACGDNGKCVDDSSFDNDFTCECSPGFEGRYCDTVIREGELRFTDQLPTILALGQQVLIEPDAYRILEGTTVLSESAFSFQALNLPFGLQMDNSTAKISGRVRVSGQRFRVFAYGVAAGEEMGTRFDWIDWQEGPLGQGVRQNSLNLEVRDCLDKFSCNGGKCVDKTPYDGEYSCNCAGTSRIGDNCEIDPFSVDWPSKEFPQGLYSSLYSAHGPDSSDVQVTGVGIDATSALAVEYAATGLPCGMTINASSGAISGFATNPGVFRVQIFAQTPQQTAQVNRRPFNLTIVDCWSNSSCNGGACIDTVPFDGDYECNCTGTGFVGEDCRDLPDPIADLQDRDDGTQDSSEASSDQSSVIVISASVAGIALLIILVIAAVVMRSRKPEAYDFSAALDRMKADGLVDKVGGGGDPDSGGVAAPREMSRHAITLLDVLGEGQFGEVWKGTVEEKMGHHRASTLPSYLAAIKTLKAEGTSSQDRSELMEEATIMAVLSHPNLVGIIGVVTRGYPVYLVMQFCEHGALQGFLQKRAGTFEELGTPQMLKISLDVAEGMAYLASKSMVHRDLAARNVLVDSSYTCKIADFGLSRRVEDNDYYRSSGGRIPVRWTAIEVMTTGSGNRRYTEKTDVWSYAVLLHEVFSHGEKPYKDLTNTVLMAKIADGYRLPRIEACPLSLYKQMMSCWDAKPDARPRFTELVAFLNSLNSGAASLKRKAYGEAGSIMETKSLGPAVTPRTSGSTPSSSTSVVVAGDAYEYQESLLLTSSPSSSGGREYEYEYQNDGPKATSANEYEYQMNEAVATSAAAAEASSAAMASGSPGTSAAAAAAVNSDYEQPVPVSAAKDSSESIDMASDVVDKTIAETSLDAASAEIAAASAAAEPTNISSTKGFEDEYLVLEDAELSV